MGLFSKTKKSAPVTGKNTATSARVDPRLARYLSANSTGFYKQAQKDENGTPRASHMYWNTNPPTPDLELQ